VVAPAAPPRYQAPAERKITLPAPTKAGPDEIFQKYAITDYQDEPPVVTDVPAPVKAKVIAPTPTPAPEPLTDLQRAFAATLDPQRRAHFEARPSGWRDTALRFASEGPAGRSLLMDTLSRKVPSVGVAGTTARWVRPTTGEMIAKAE
jgi:hypothetical protein